MLINIILWETIESLGVPFKLSFFLLFDKVNPVGNDTLAVIIIEILLTMNIGKNRDMVIIP